MELAGNAWKIVEKFSEQLPSLNAIAKRAREEIAKYRKGNVGFLNKDLENVSVIVRYNARLSLEVNSSNGSFGEDPLFFRVETKSICGAKVLSSTFLYADYPGANKKNLERVVNSVKENIIEHYLETRGNAKSIKRFDGVIEGRDIQINEKFRSSEELLSIAQQISEELSQESFVLEAMVSLGNYVQIDAISAFYGRGSVDVLKASSLTYGIIELEMRDSRKYLVSMDTFGTASGRIDERFMKQIIESGERILEHFSEAKVVDLNGNYNVLVGGKASGVVFHELLGHMNEKDVSLIKGGSNLPSKLRNRRITHPEFNAIDMPSGPFVSAKYDDQGIPARDVVLVRKGVLKSYLTELDTGGVKSNGHGRGVNRVYPESYNIRIDPGKRSLDELLSNAQVYIAGVMPYAMIIGNLAVSEVSLEGARVYLIKGGELVPVVPRHWRSQKMRLGFEELSKIAGIGNESTVETYTGLCKKHNENIYNSVTSPAVLFKNLVLYTSSR